MESGIREKTLGETEDMGIKYGCQLTRCNECITLMQGTDNRNVGVGYMGTLLLLQQFCRFELLYTFRFISTKVGACSCTRVAGK